MDVEQIVGIVASLASILAIVTAGGWFLYTTKFKPRLQFDVECRFLPIAGAQALLAELDFVFRNTGFVEHRLWNVTVSVHALADESRVESVPDTREVQFSRRIVPKTQLVSGHYGYYFVRSGVRQVVTHTIEIPRDVSLIRVTAGFDYTKNDKYPHTARRVFQVPKQASHTSG